ncbi:MAG TPA: porin family protein [Chitinophagaceae bacterium]
MKKFFLLIVTTFCSIILLKAQETHFGIKAGANFSTVDVSNGTDYDTKVGFHAGGLAHIHVSRHFAIQPELMYSTQGGKVGDFKLKLNYINLPVLVQYMINDGFRLQTGPQIGFRTSAKSELGDVTIDRKSEYKSVDFAWTFGAGYLFPEGIGIDARYNLGISDITETENTKAKNNVFQVGLFYQFMHQHSKKK